MTKLSVGSISLPKSSASIKVPKAPAPKKISISKPDKLTSSNKGLVKFMSAKRFGASAMARSAAKAQPMQMDVKGG